MWRSVKNYLAHAAPGQPRGWHPLLAVYYLTYSCQFRCPYCCDGSNTPYHQLPGQDLPADRVMKLLSHVRRYSDYLVLTGGEPLEHPDFATVLERLPSVGFDGVVLTTNGHDTTPHLPVINRAIRYLVFSIDTLDHEKADRWFGMGPGTLQRVLSSLEQAEAFPGRRYEIIISAVATPGNLEDLFEVYSYCRERGFRFALCPQLLGVKPHPALFDNPVYVKLFDLLIEEKKQGQPVNGSVLYLEHMRSLTKFNCRPSTVLAISPRGDVFFPCLEIGKVAGNLLDTPDLHAIRRAGLEIHGPEPSCDNRCHSACALGFSLILNQPVSMAREALLMMKAAWRGRSCLHVYTR